MSSLIKFPLIIISKEFFMPISLGNRCVPPAPGNKPILTSGNPKKLFLKEILKCAERANSNPPPKIYPCKIATTGFFEFSIRLQTSESEGDKNSLLNSLMSAPTEKFFPLPFIKIILTFSLS